MAEASKPAPPSWEELAKSLLPGAAARQRAAEALRRQQLEQAEKAKPAPPDPKDVLISAWIATNPSAFEALCNVIDGMIQAAAATRRESVASHSWLAFYEGETASLEQLRIRLKRLSGQA